MKKQVYLFFLLFAMISCKKETFTSNIGDLNGKWRLVKIVNLQKVETTNVADGEENQVVFTISISDLTFNGNVKCNTAFRHFKIDNATLQLGGESKTKAGCRSDWTDKYDATMGLQARTALFSRSGTKLLFKLNDNLHLLTFEKM